MLASCAEPVVAQALLRQGGDLLGELERRGERLPVVDDPVGEADARAPRRRRPARPVRIRSMARPWPMSRGRRTVPRSISGTPKRRQKTPKMASLAGDAQVAPQGELDAAGDGVALDRGDHRLGQPQPRRPHWPVAPCPRRGRRGVVRVARRRMPRRRAVGAGAERAAGAGEDRDARAVVGIECAERVGERPAVGPSTALRTSGRSIVTVQTAPRGRCGRCSTARSSSLPGCSTSATVSAARVSRSTRCALRGLRAGTRWPRN